MASNNNPVEESDRELARAGEKIKKTILRAAEKIFSKQDAPMAYFCDNAGRRPEQKPSMYLKQPFYFSYDDPMLRCHITPSGVYRYMKCGHIGHHDVLDRSSAVELSVKEYSLYSSIILEVMEYRDKTWKEGIEIEKRRVLREKEEHRARREEKNMSSSARGLQSRDSGITISSDHQASDARKGFDPPSDPTRFGVETYESAKNRGAFTGSRADFERYSEVARSNMRDRKK